MASGKSAELIYELIEELGDQSTEMIFKDLVKWMTGEDIIDFVKYFRRNHDIDITQDFETNEYVMCMSCQDTHHEDKDCANKDCNKTQPPAGSSSYFSSLIPEC